MVCMDRMLVFTDTECMDMEDMAMEAMVDMVDMEATADMEAALQDMVAIMAKGTVVIIIHLL